MAKTLSFLRNQKPSWIRVDEPVSGSTNPTAQDSTVQPDGTVTHNVEGVNNRTAAQLWGLLKLMADVVDAGHNDEGNHELTDEDIKAGAGILENKIAFDFGGMLRPSDGSAYENTADIVEEIAYWAPYYLLARHSADLGAAHNQDRKYHTVRPNGWLKPNPISGYVKNLMVANNEEFYLAGRLFLLNGTNSPDNTCLIDIGMPSDSAADDLSTQVQIWIEFFYHDVTTTGVLFPYGNTQYRNVNSAANTHGIPYEHTDQVVGLDSPDLVSYLGNTRNNLFTGPNGKLMQVVYAIRSAPIAYSSHKYGMTDPSLRSISGATFTQQVDGTYSASDSSSFAYPMGIVVRRNLGAYHPTINPAGCAPLRSSAVIVSFTDCFNHNNIAYHADNGAQCPNYGTAVYDPDEDTYALAGVTYYRGGRSVTTVSGHPDGLYSDFVVAADVNLSKPLSIARDLVADYIINKALMGAIRPELTPLYYGTVSDMHESGYWQDRTLQHVGFGVSEADVFGTNNLGGVFIDKTNNGRSAVADGIRYMWSDESTVQRVCVSFTEGLDNSEDKPQVLTYEPLSRAVSLNSTGLSGTPLISSSVPVMVWENGDLVVLSTPWTGMSTTSAACVISTTDVTAHAGQVCYIEFSLLYAQGSGIPFMPKQAVYGKDRDDTKYLPVDINTTTLGFSFSGVAGSGSTVTEVVLGATGSSVANFYTGMHLVVLASNDVAAGTAVKISAYNGVTKRATVTPALPAALAAGDKIAISYVPNPTLLDNSLVLVDPYARAVLGTPKRAFFVANASGIVTVGKPIIQASAGMVVAGIVKGLQVGEAVDIIYYDETPFQHSFWLAFHNDYTAPCFKPLPASGVCSFIDAGRYLATNIGSANNGLKAYMGTLPNTHWPEVSDISWIGTNTVDTEQVTVIGDPKTLTWATVPPYAGLQFNYASLLTQDTVDGVAVGLSSLSEVIDPNSGMIAVGSLVRDNDGYKILFAITTHGQLTYANRNKLFLFDLRKFIGYTYY